jgi:hypothetical protein
MSLQQVREMPIDDFVDLLAFFKMREKRIELERRKQEIRRLRRRQG